MFAAERFGVTQRVVEGHERVVLGVDHRELARVFPDGYPVDGMAEELRERLHVDERREKRTDKDRGAEADLHFLLKETDRECGAKTMRDQQGVRRPGLRERRDRIHPFLIVWTKRIRQRGHGNGDTPVLKLGMQPGKPHLFGGDAIPVDDDDPVYWTH